MNQQLELLIRAGTPLISIQTTDEERALGILRRLARDTGRAIYEWSLVTGMKHFKAGSPVGAQATKPGDAAAAVRYAFEHQDGSLYIFKDLGPHTKDALVNRLLREASLLAQENETALVMIDAQPLPNEIRRFAVQHEIGWPSVEELEDVVKATYQRIKRETGNKVTSSLTVGEMERLVQTLRGLSSSEAERVVAAAIHQDLELSGEDLPRIVESKRTLLGSAGCLEAVVADFSVDDIGGLTNLKGWLRQRRGGFSRKAREFGIEPPRGVLMLGVPGCGKSLCAKVVASDWKMTLLRLDPGVLYQKYIGESESQLRQALAQAEAMAPVVLWVDEIEKAFASASASSADGGLSKRMFGTLLSWMQDHRHPIFIVATANDLSALPPELMRKGRFDEVFFVDLPDLNARKRIFEIHIRRRKRDPSRFDIHEMAEAAKDFSGSEIEQVVVSALFAAFTDKKELSQAHILAELAKTQPLSGLMAERVDELRMWSDGRCVPAD